MSKPTDEDELAAEWHDVMGLYHRVTCALDRALVARHGLSVSEFEVLQQLHVAGRSDTKVRMSELGDTVHLSQSALSRLIGRLEGMGLVERTMCEEDRRSVHICITPDGSRRFLDARPTQRSTLRDLMAPPAAGRDRAADGHA